jgi:calcium-dependent protein kinase
MHRSEFVHRDLKLENIMFVSGNESHLKLIDFGFSKTRRKTGAKMKTDCGTLAYIAPEVLEKDKEYTSQCDMWSLGVIVYILLSGQMPFFGPDREQIQKIKEGQYPMEAARWSTISGDAILFVQALMKKNPEQRLTAEQALQHKWLGTRSLRPRVVVHPSMVRALCSHSLEPKLRRCCRRMLAEMLPSNQQVRAYELFVNLDESHAGAVTLGKWLEKDGIGNEVLKTFSKEDQAMLESIGTSLEYSYSEVLAALVTTELCVSDDMIACVFQKFDLQKSGRITWGQLETTIENACEDVGIDIDEATADANKELTCPEFQRFLRGSARLSLPWSSISTSVGGESYDSHQSSLSVMEPKPKCVTPPTPFAARTPGSTPMRSHLRASCRGFDHIVEADRSPACPYPVLLPKSGFESRSPFSSHSINSSATCKKVRWADASAFTAPPSRGDQCACILM